MAARFFSYYNWSFFDHRRFRRSRAKRRRRPPVFARCIGRSAFRVVQPSQLAAQPPPQSASAGEMHANAPPPSPNAVAPPPTIAVSPTAVATARRLLQHFQALRDRMSRAAGTIVLMDQFLIIIVLLIFTIIDRYVLDNLIAQAIAQQKHRFIIGELLNLILPSQLLFISVSTIAPLNRQTSKRSSGCFVYG